MTAAPATSHGTGTGTGSGTGRAHTAGRAELLRGLGSVLLTPPPDSAGVLAALGLPAQTAAEYTAAFVLGAPPHAAIHLGPEGKLGGDGQDRVAGFWRALGLAPPPDADHLGVLLMLCAELDEAGAAASSGAARAQLARARTTLLTEHVHSWAPAYLAAVGGLGIDSVTAWARLTATALLAEPGAGAGLLPAALREAPPGLHDGLDRDELLDALVAPVRVGFPLSWPDLRECASVLSLGVRRGERRFALASLLDQEPAGTLGWLGGLAGRWSRTHTRLGPDGAAARWWSARAAASSAVLRQMSERPTR